MINKIKGSPNQLVASAFGAIYLLVGLVGFVVTGFDGFASSAATHKLIFFQLNGLHNVVHIAIGALLLFAGQRNPRDAAAANISVGGTYLIVGLLGLFAVGANFNIIAINHPDNALHLVSAIALLFLGLSGDGVAKPAPLTFEDSSLSSATELADDLEWERDDLDSKSKDALYEMAQNAGIPGRSTMSRAELASALRKSGVNG